ncbi:hypothetical protein FsymDg_1046 [Candidatus Protofrankia datiscae]|uniref:Uncharacterized protein n=1 Tax=Candidatus Protofrankia datiscae TaxID=2716812 RepID=F8AY45_9ACTN|nr:hypothetical protein FsymDg_1046 [Candidatus Protofrankia datiscae]
MASGGCFRRFPAVPGRWSWSAGSPSPGPRGDPPAAGGTGFAVAGRPETRPRTLADVFAYAAAGGERLRTGGTEVQVRRPRAGRPGRSAFVLGKRRQNTAKTTGISDGPGRPLWSGAARPHARPDRDAQRGHRRTVPLTPAGPGRRRRGLPRVLLRGACRYCWDGLRPCGPQTDPTPGEFGTRPASAGHLLIIHQPARQGRETRERRAVGTLAATPVTRTRLPSAPGSPIHAGCPGQGRRWPG